MSTQGGWHAGLSKTNPDLFRAVFDFNRRPQHWVHPTVLAGLPHAPVVTALAASYHGAGHLSAWLLKQLGLADLPQCWNFEEPRRRLFLLGHATLERLASFCGAAAHWPRMAAVIGRAEIRELKDSLGEDAHSFALRSGRMIVPQAETVPLATGVPVPQQIMQTGWRMLATVLEADAGGADDGVLRRWRLKLPPATAESLAASPAAQAGERERAWQRVRRICPHVFTEGEMKCFA